MKKIRLLEISVSVGLIIAFVVSSARFGAKCGEIRKDAIRLHILANSDSPEDQRAKLLVRDALVNGGAELFSGILTRESAEKTLVNRKEELSKIADGVLCENGFDYRAKTTLVYEYFNTRAYGDITMPAGMYTALKIELGKGEGRNWWCVIFPPLCLPAAREKTDADVFFGDGAGKIIKSNPKYEIRFKIVEIFENLKRRTGGRSHA